MPLSADKLAFVRNLLGPNAVVTDSATLEPYLQSWRNAWAGRAQLMLFPNSVEQVSKLVQFYHQHNIAIVPQGGNTGLVGGTYTNENQVLVNLSRLNKVREIDKTSSIATVEAGVVLQNLQEAARDAGLLFPLSIASEGSAEIGGLISTNAGGTAVLRYGTMRDLVLGIEAVLPNGQIINGLKKLPKDNAGYNLGRFFIGAEGTLGIVTAATLKLYPAPRQSLTVFAALRDAAASLDVLRAVRAEAGEYLSTFEIMSREGLELVLKHIPNSRIPCAFDAPFYALIELTSSSEHVPLRTIFEDLAAKIFEQGIVTDAALAESDAQAKQFWHLREHLSEALRKQGGGIHFDIALPLDQIADFLSVIAPKIKAIDPTITLMPFGHIGDGNLHYNMYPQVRPDDAAFARLKQHVKDVVYDEINRRGGSISAEHGIGLERKAELLGHRSSREIDLMRRIKQAFDPDNLMNPGKIFD